jgi:hypothetical protein
MAGFQVKINPLCHAINFKLVQHVQRLQIQKFWRSATLICPHPSRPSLSYPLGKSMQRGLGLRAKSMFHTLTSCAKGRSQLTCRGAPSCRFFIRGFPPDKNDARGYPVEELAGARCEYFYSANPYFLMVRRRGFLVQNRLIGLRLKSTHSTIFSTLAAILSNSV